jgi:hypothetical protein
MALRTPELPLDQRLNLSEKLREGQIREKPEPVYYYNWVGPPSTFEHCPLHLWSTVSRSGIDRIAAVGMQNLPRYIG